MTRTALVFPGQGSQSLGMLSAAPDDGRLAALVAQASNLVGTDLFELAEQGPEEALADTRFAQPLLFLAGWAWGQALLDRGVAADAVAGHSLGEISALAVAGVFPVETGLELVVQRGRLMADAALGSQGAMAAVLGLDADTISDAIAQIDGVWVANDNAPGQIVISGKANAVEEATGALAGAGARRVVPLKVSGAFHSPLMESARAAFAEVIAPIAFSDASLPVYQNTDPTPAVDGAGIKARLATQITSPVRWTETMLALAEDGPVTLVEAGPGNVLVGLARRIDGIDALSASVSGIDAVIEGVS